MIFLSTIIKQNTFQVNNNYCHQIIGLPMGGPLSGVLSNIYLGYMERNIYNTNIIIYQRYMDDILMISNHDMYQMDHVLTSLKNDFGLKLTSSSNCHNVTFLDMCISINRIRNKLSICPYGKAQPIYPIPSIITGRHFNMDKNIIISQILRTWRNSTDNKKFSRNINYYLSFLQGNQHHRKLRKSIFRFLLPCKISTNYWSTNITLCPTCCNMTNETQTDVHKIMCINGDYIGSKEPVSCKTTNIYIIINYESNYQLLRIKSIHEYFENNQTSNSNIMPLGKLTKSKIYTFINKNKNIIHSLEKIHNKIKYPCRIHPIFKNSYHIYGVRNCDRKRRTFTSYFNLYKKISQRKQKKDE